MYKCSCTEPLAFVLHGEREAETRATNYWQTAPGTLASYIVCRSEWCWGHESTNERFELPRSNYTLGIEELGISNVKETHVKAGSFYARYTDSKSFLLLYTFFFDVVTKLRKNMNWYSRGLHVQLASDPSANLQFLVIFGCNLKVDFRNNHFIYMRDVVVSMMSLSFFSLIGFGSFWAPVPWCKLAEEGALARDFPVDSARKSESHPLNKI